MKLVHAKYEIIPQLPGMTGVYKAIEYPGRVCYGSQDKIGPNSAQPFVERLMKSNHGAPMEHGTIYLTIPGYDEIAEKYDDNPYSKVNAVEDPSKYINGKRFTTYYITTNYRVLFENGWMNDITFMSEPTEHHERRIMVKFTIDRFTGEEFLRHRHGSFNRESTRYCNYNSEKFGGGDITFILPPWIKDETPLNDNKYDEMSVQFAKERKLWWRILKKLRIWIPEYFTPEEIWKHALKTSENCYNNLIEAGWKPQQARTVLPCAINSPLIMTMFVSDWKHFFDLRALGTTGAPHPQAKELAEPLMKEFIKLGYLTEDEVYNNI